MIGNRFGGAALVQIFPALNQGRVLVWYMSSEMRGHIVGIIVLFLCSAMCAQQPTSTTSTTPAANSAPGEPSALATPAPDRDGVYEVAKSALRMMVTNPKVEFPPAAAAYEIDDTVVLAVTISPEGKVSKIKATAGRIQALKEAAQTTVKKWEFEPYLMHGAAVPVRTEMTFHFDNTLDHYRDQDGSKPVRIDEKTMHALLTRQVPPHYPPDARADRIQGSVELRAIVGKDGTIHALHVLHGHPMLAPAAYEAVRQWTFKPYEVNGVATSVDTIVTIHFTLSG